MILVRLFKILTAHNRPPHPPPLRFLKGEAYVALLEKN